MRSFKWERRGEHPGPNSGAMEHELTPNLEHFSGVDCSRRNRRKCFCDID